MSTDIAEAQDEQPEAKSTEVAKVEKPSLETGEGGFIVPRNLDEAYRFAVGVVRGGLAPSSYNNDPSKIMLGIAAALEAGLPPLYGLRNIAIIKGNPTIWGDAVMALIQSRGLLKNQKSQEIGSQFEKATTELQDWPDDFGFETRLWRVGQEDPYVGQFTVGDAKRANLWLNTKKVPWIQFPLRMLKIRSRSFPLRDGFADALAGLSLREEAEDRYGGEVDKVDAASLFSDEPEVSEFVEPESEAADDTV